MPKAAKTAINKGTKDANSKNFTKVIKTVRNPRTGSYSFKEGIVHKEKVKEFLAGAK